MEVRAQVKRLKTRFFAEPDLFADALVLLHTIPVFCPAHVLILN